MIDNSRSIIKTRCSELSVDVLPAIERRTVSQHQQLSLADLFRTVARRKTPMLLFAVIVLGLVGAYTFLKTPMYEGVARLQIDPTHPTNLGLDSETDKQATTDVDSRIKTEVTIIQSDTVAMQVMRELRLYADPHFAGKYTVRTPIRNLADLTPTQRRRLMDCFKDNLTVKTIPATQVVEIRFRNSDPILATKVANSIIDEYLQRNLAARVEGTAQVSQWVSRQMQEIRAGATTAQEKLADFQRVHNMLGTDESDNIVTDRLKQLNEELTQAEADRIVKEGRYRLASSGNAELIGSLAPSTTLQVLRTQEADLRAQIAQLSAKFGNGYPKLRELQEQLGQLESAIGSEGVNIKTRLANEFDAASKAESMIRSDFEQQKSEAYRLNENAAQYAILKHEVESGQQLYDTLQLKLKEADVASGLTSSYVSVVDRAQVPDRPVEPKKRLYLALGLGGGLFGGLLLAMLLDSFDDTVQSSAELESMIALPELGSVPSFLGTTSKKLKASEAANLIGMEGQFDPISIRDPNSQAAEAYRALCSVILLSSDENPPKAIVVTSAMPGEGKSTVSCNLATALAQRARRVLLVDADLRCSSIHPQLGARPGLSTMFSTKPKDGCPGYRPLADLPNLEVLPAGFRPTGTAGSTEILASAWMQGLMALWSTEYDHIIIDTPPVVPFADALALSARADGVILVTRSGVSRTDAVIRARDVLARSGANILGFVLNAVRRPEYYFAYPSAYRSHYTELKTGANGAGGA